MNLLLIALLISQRPDPLMPLAVELAAVRINATRTLHVRTWSQREYYVRRAASAAYAIDVRMHSKWSKSLTVRVVDVAESILERDRRHLETNVDAVLFVCDKLDKGKGRLER